MALNANALTTLVMAKAYLKIPTVETSMDSMIELFINASSQMLESEIDRKIKAQSITEVHHGRDSNIIMLNEWPVNSITELRIGSDFSDPLTIIDPDDYSIGDEENCIILTNRRFGRGYNNTRIIYNGGYSAVPSDLEHACLWMVFYYRMMRESGDIGRTSKGKGDESISILQEAPLDVKNTIARYRRMEIPNIGLPMSNT
jgi:hypothetical protein